MGTRILIALCLMGLSLPSHSVELTPYVAEYKARFETGIPIKGKAVRKLHQKKDGKWEYRFDVNSFVADIKESVSLDWQNNQVIPHAYRYSLEGLFIKDRKAKVDFDWKEMRVLNDIKKKPWYMDIPEFALDKLGYQLQLHMDLSMGKDEVFYQVADGGKLKDFHFKVIGEETLKTSLGEAETIIVEKVRNAKKKRKTTMWFAKNWQHLLVKMVHVEKDGESYEINLNKAKIGDLVLGY